MNNGQFQFGHKINKGRVMSDATRRKIGKIHKGKLKSLDHKIKISKTLLGRSLTKDHILSISNSKIGHIVSNETRKKIGESNRTTLKKISENNRGRMPVNQQKPGIFNNIVRGYFNIGGKMMFFRSKWEANYALYLNFLIKQGEIDRWEYEPESFLFEKIRSGTRTYRPDFKVYKKDGSFVFHEVKGWMDPKSLTKLKRMRIYFPHIKIIVIDGDSYKDVKSKIGRMLKFF